MLAGQPHCDLSCRASCVRNPWRVMKSIIYFCQVGQAGHFGKEELHLMSKLVASGSLTFSK